MTWNRWDESSSAQLATVWVEVVRDGGVGELYCPVQLIFGRRSEWSAVIHEISSIRAAAAQSSPFYAGSPLTSPSSSLWTSECTSIIHSLINGLQLNYQLTAVGCGIWSHPKDLISYMCECCDPYILIVMLSLDVRCYLLSGFFQDSNLLLVQVTRSPN